MFALRSAVAAGTVTVDKFSQRTIAEMGAVGSCPVKAVIEATFARAGEGLLLMTYWTSGRTSGHSLKSMRNSETIVRIVRTSSLPNRSTAPLLHGL